MRRDNFLNVFEVWIIDNLFSGNSFEGVQDEHFLNEFGETLWAGWEKSSEGDFLFVGFGMEIESKFNEHFVSLSPGMIGRLFDHGKNLTDLIDVIGSRKKRIPKIKFNNNTAKTEDINCYGILLCTK